MCLIARLTRFNIVAHLTRRPEQVPRLNNSTDEDPSMVKKKTKKKERCDRQAANHVTARYRKNGPNSLDPPLVRMGAD